VTHALPVGRNCQPQQPPDLDRDRTLTIQQYYVPPAPSGSRWRQSPRHEGIRRPHGPRRRQSPGRPGQAGRIRLRGRIAFGRHILFSSDRAQPGGDSDLYVMNPDGSAITRLTHADSEEQEPTLSPCRGARQ
jgi:WD40-like Beta Propeller Repeat